MNMNDLAKLVADFEGKKKEMSIAQIKEVLKILVQLEAYDQAPILASLGQAVCKELKTSF